MKRQLQRFVAGLGLLAFAATPVMAASQTINSVAYEAAEKGSQYNPFVVPDLYDMPEPPSSEPVSDVWLDAYIVGWVNGMFYTSGARFELDPAGETDSGNIIVGPSADCTDPASCIPLDLAWGSEVRTHLNLKDHPENLGKRIKVHGDFAKYFGRRGFKEVDEWEFIEDEEPDDPDPSLPDYTMYVVGSNVNGSTWTLAAEDAEMNMTSAGVWEWYGEVLGSGFKFNAGSWDSAYNIGAPGDASLTLDVPYTVTNDGLSKDITFDGDLLQINKPHIVLDLNKMEVTVSGTTKDVDLKYYLVGDFNEWVLGLNQYTFALQSDGSYKIANYTISNSKGTGVSNGALLVASDGYSLKYGASDAAVVLTPGTTMNLMQGGENVVYSIPDGKYDVIFNDADAPTLKFVPIYDADKGTMENPYTVEEIYMMDVNDNIANVWIKAYIVGWVDGANYLDGIHFDFPADVTVTQTNIVIADKMNENNPEVCIPVQLPGGEVRTKLNLNANPGNMGKQVLLRGDYVKYFSRRGLKNTSKFQFVVETGDPVALTVKIADGPAMKSQAYDKAAMVLNVAFDDEYWEVTEASVNGEKLFDTPAANADIKFTVNGDTQVDVKVGYKGELQFVETSGVVELTDAIKVGVADGKVYVEGLAEGEEVVVYSMAGMIIGSHKATDSRLEIKLDKGAYVVRVGEKAAKVAL